MDKFRYDNQEEGLVILYAMDADQMIDTLSMGMLRERRFEHIMKAVFYISDNQERMLKFITENRTSLIGCLQKGISRNRLLDIFIKIIEILEEADEYLFIREYFQLRPEHIVIDESGQNIALLYLPCISVPEQAPDMWSLLDTILHRVNLSEADPEAGISRIREIAGASDTLLQLKEELKKYQNEPAEVKREAIPVPPASPIPPVPAPSPMPSVPEAAPAPPVPPVSPLPVPQFAEQPAVYIPKEGETSVLSMQMQAGETEVLSGANDTVVYPAHLVRVKNQERINIEKMEFYIGKEMENDYVVYDNPTVSRKHAVLCLQNGQYYVMDKNSKNHTYINGNMINPMENVLIRHGDFLRLSNEEFVFYMS